MEYSSEFGAVIITFTIRMLDFKLIQSIKKCLNVSFHSLLNVEEVKFFIIL